MKNQDDYLISKLINYDSLKYLNELNIRSESDIDELSEEDILNLIQIASIYALSIDEKKQIFAYEIVTKLFINFYEEYPNLYSISYCILSRLGNFPNRDLLKKLKPTEEYRSQNFLFDLEILARENENKLSLSDECLLLTDFQKQFFDVLTTSDFYSVSAPTSAGKSFILSLSIIKRLLNNDKEVIVLVVPTRALIKELSESIIKKLKEFELFDKVDVRVIPIVEEESVKKGKVYVITQERLKALLDQDEITINACFIDEAQEIQSNRGVVLQNTIEFLLQKNPNVKLFFASPLIKNPEYFNKLFKQNFHNNYFIENVSPVSQNIFLLSQVKNKPKKIRIDRIGEYLSRDMLGNFSIDFKFRGNRHIALAKQITRDDELTLVYCNGAKDAEKKALSLAEMLDDVDCEEIADLISFLEEDIHKDFSIINCLKKGVAYHYGYMPSSVRTEVENLASKGKIRFIFCTSTLLQGINLPAKNIIVDRPMRGNNTPMNRADFLNLVGRAGRLLHEFHGNIWCIDPDSWCEKSFEGEKLQEIKGYFENTLLAKTDEIIDVAENNANKEQGVFGKFFSDYVLDGQNILIYKDHENFEKIEKLLEISKNINYSLPSEILKKHSAIHPTKLNNMYLFLQGTQEISKLIPKKSYQPSVNKVLTEIFRKIGIIFFDVSTSNKQFSFYSTIASKWIHDTLLKDIILKHSSHYNKEINLSIREVLECLEKNIRYKYVVATHAYMDILKLVLKEKDESYDVDSLPNLPLYLECGTSDNLVLNLISLGLSRLTSIKLKNNNNLEFNEITVKGCFDTLRKVNIETLDIPEVCKREIKALISD
ncbi:DEAD/DEAH box helicase [Francisella philomiragia]|uniref:DEAD/DEAH box helicase n=1 Tax=Francisella philomiragia TaxID=28110 RepID=UPI001908FFB5|nr:DEAD/DEAH box helicase [Francisella philomiragia]MBK2266885.1 DEAD/DEAH box helicase [Francisella philomiragia]MBK2307152.1 DEAD/DEAH box helicase [Francisella philomiragia]